MECLALPWSQVPPPGQFEAVLAIAYSIEAMQQTSISQTSPVASLHRLSNASKSEASSTGAA